MNSSHCPKFPKIWKIPRYELRRCVRNPFWKVCGMCVRAAHFRACDVRSYFCTFFGTKLPENATFCLKTILECPILFRTSCFVMEHPKNVERLLKKIKKLLKKTEKLLIFLRITKSASSSNWRCVCATQKMVATHTLLNTWLPHY